MVIEIKYSVYPFSLDGTNQLPIVTDNITPVIAEVVNRQRSAIIAVEGELGIDPSGVYTTVRARLDALESLIGTLGGGGGIESVSKNGIQIVSNATNLNFVGDAVSVINSGSGTARIEILGTTTQVQETIAVDAPGDTAFTLSDIPLDVTAVQMYINGQKQQYGTDYVISGTSVTYSGVPALTVTDDVEFWYLVSAFLSGGGGGGENLSQTLAIGNSTDGYDINLNFGSAIVSSDGTVLVNDDLHVTGKLTVDGLIDPPGLVLDEQVSSPYDPSSTGTEGLIWVRTDGYLMYTDQTNTDHVIDFDGVGSGGGGGITSIITTANGVASSETITPSTSITSGAVTIDLPYISLEDAKVIIGADFGISAADTTDSSVFIGGAMAPSVNSALVGSLNVIIGYNALTSFTGGDTLIENVVIGAGAAASMTNMSNNVIIGKSALPGGLSAPFVTDSVFIGYHVGPNSLFSTIGADNVYIGRYAGSSINDINAANSVVLGSNACQSTQNIVDSVMIGDSVGASATPTRSIVIGRQAGGSAFNPVTDSQLIGDQIGTGAVRSFIAGTQAGGFGDVTDSILIGYQAGNTLFSGANNVLIGSDIDVPTDSTSNYTSLNDILISNGTNTDIYESSGGTLALRVNANTDIASASTGQVLVKGASGALEFIDGYSIPGISPNFLSYRIERALYTGKHMDFGVSGFNHRNVNSMFMSPDGTKLFIQNSTGVPPTGVGQLTLSTPWDINSATLDGVFATSGEDTTPKGVTFNSDGSRMYVIGDTGNALYQYNIAPGNEYDIITVPPTLAGNFSVAGQTTAPNGVIITPDDSTIIVSSGTNFYQYSLSTAGEIIGGSMSYASLSLAGNGNGMCWGDGRDGTPGGRLFYADGSQVRAVLCPVSYTLSGASLDLTIFNPAENTVMRGVYFSLDGYLMWVCGPDDVFEYYTTAVIPNV